MYQQEEEQENKQSERQYVYSYSTCEIQKCHYCNQWIENKLCTHIAENKIYYFHRPCLYKFYCKI